MPYEVRVGDDVFFVCKCCDVATERLNNVTESARQWVEMNKEECSEGDKAT